MEPAKTSLTLPDEAATIAFGAAIAPLLSLGDVLLLSGPIGAGKSSLCRAIIQTRLAKLGRVEDVPSPTFTLVQTYELDDVDLWHCDLYRLTHPDEVLDLGLDDAFDTAICLVEWPDRLGEATPPDALRLDLEIAGESRKLTITGAEAHKWRKLDDLLQTRPGGVCV